MKKLSQLLESINEIDSLLEIDFKDKKAFQKYQSIHKMKPTTKVNIAGKDTTVGDETGDDSQAPEAPKKMTGKDVDNKAVANAKAQDDIEKDIMGDEPKGDTTADTLTKGLKDGGLNPYKDGPMINQALDDIGGDHSDLKKKIDTYGDNVPSSRGKSEAQYQKEIDKYKEEGEKLSNDIVDAISDKPKSDKPVKLDDDAQQAIDGMDWNKYDDQGRTNVTKVINDLDDNVDEWNQQIYNTVEELEGQIPQEDLDKLYSAEVDVMELDDEALSEVPREELEKKTKALIDFHKKYSTIGKKTTAQEKDPNRDKKTGFKPGSSFGSNIGYRTGKNRGGGMYDNVNPKSSTPLKELSKITTRYNKWLS